MHRFLLACAGYIVIDRLLDAHSLFELGYMLLKQHPIECVRMVEVNVLTFLDRHVTTILVVGVLRYNHHLAFGETFGQFADYSCLSGTGTTGNANNKHIFRILLGPFFCSIENGIVWCRFPDKRPLIASVV